MNFKKFFTNREDNFISLDKDFFRFIAECLIVQKNISKVGFVEHERFQKIIDDCYYDMSCIILGRDFSPKSQVLHAKIIGGEVAKYIEELYDKR